MSSGTEGEVYEYRDHEPRKRWTEMDFFTCVFQPWDRLAISVFYLIVLHYIQWVCLYNTMKNATKTNRSDRVVNAGKTDMHSEPFYHGFMKKDSIHEDSLSESVPQKQSAADRLTATIRACAQCALEADTGVLMLRTIKH